MRFSRYGGTGMRQGFIRLSICCTLQGSPELKTTAPKLKRWLRESRPQRSVIVGVRVAIRRRFLPLEELAPILRLAAVPGAEVHPASVVDLGLEECGFGGLEVLVLNNGGGDEDQEIPFVLGLVRAAERRPQEGNVAKAGDLGVAALLVVRDQAAHDEGIAAGNEDLGFDA